MGLLFSSLLFSSLLFSSLLFSSLLFSLCICQNLLKTIAPVVGIFIAGILFHLGDPPHSGRLLRMVGNVMDISHIFRCFGFIFLHTLPVDLVEMMAKLLDTSPITSQMLQLVIYYQLETFSYL